MKKTAVILSLLIALAPPAEAQFFKKLKDAKKKIENLGTNPGTNNNVPASESGQYESNSDIYIPPRIHDDIPEGKIELNRDCSGFKVTPATKIVEVDRIPTRKGVFHDGMAMLLFYSGQKAFITKEGKLLTFGGKISDRESGPTAPTFSNGRAPLHLGNSFAIVDKSGNTVKALPATVSETYGFIDGAGIVQHKRDKAGLFRFEFIDTNGNKIYPALSYSTKGYTFVNKDCIRPKSEGMRAVPRVGDTFVKWGFCNESGAIAVPQEYFCVKDFHDGVAAVQLAEQSFSSIKGGKWGFVDKKGNVVIDFKFTNEPSDFSGGYAMVKNKSGQTVLIDKSGSTVYTPEQYWDLTMPIDGISLLCGSTVDKDGFKRRVCYALADGGKVKKAYFEGDVNDTDIKVFGGKAYISYGMSYLALLDVPTMNTVVSGLNGPFGDGLAAVADGYVNEKGEYVIRFKESEF